MKIFYLGTHKPTWLKRTDTPFFISNRAMRLIKFLKPAQGPWVLDSGGFTELNMYGEWTITPETYIEEVRRYVDRVGNLQWVAPMDWMCEPNVIKKTGKTVREHQKLTIDNYLILQQQLGNLVAPVLQGWTIDDYLHHIEDYNKRGIDLSGYSTVGVGSICRRGAKDEISRIVHRLYEENIKMHTFGVKGAALKMIHPVIKSSDSMAWCMAASFDQPMEGHTHKKCSNCMEYALRWRERLLSKCPLESDLCYNT
jgi:hypothetical protein